jgi:hypothetical protein
MDKTTKQNLAVTRRIIDRTSDGVDVLQNNQLIRRDSSNERDNEALFDQKEASAREATLAVFHFIHQPLKLQNW